MIKKETPGLVDARHRGEKFEANSPNLVALNENFNPPNLARRKRFQHLGRELHRRGEYPNAQFCAWLADQPNAAEILQCLEDFCRLSVAEYMAIDADRFPSYLIPLDGGRP